MHRPHVMRALLALVLCVGTLAAGEDWPTEAEIAAITYEDVQDDNGFVGPFAHDLSRNEEFPERKVDWQAYVDKVNKWAPGKVENELDRVRNLINACVLQDICQGQFEGELPLFIYTRLKDQIPKDRLVRILARLTLHPDQGDLIRTAPELDADVGVGEDQIRERMPIYAKKMLGRVLGKIPLEQK